MQLPIAQKSIWKTDDVDKDIDRQTHQASRVLPRPYLKTADIGFEPRGRYRLPEKLHLVEPGSFPAEPVLQQHVLFRSDQ